MTKDEVFELIYHALQAFQHDKINDVTRESGETEDQIIITTEDGELQVFVLGADSLLETDPPLE